MAREILVVLCDEEMARCALVILGSIVVVKSALEMEYDRTHSCKVSESTAAQESLPEPRMENKVG